MSAIIETTEKTTELICKHCGISCDTSIKNTKGDYFCCNGCETVWNLLQDSNLGSYYKVIDSNHGIKINTKSEFAFLDNIDVENKLVSFTTSDSKTVIFDLPEIHCAACVWLLEKLPYLNESIIQSRVDFLKKQCTVIYNSEKTNLKEIAELLNRIGYTPRFNLSNVDNDHHIKSNKQLLYKIGLTAFSFGNIMLLSFPEYLGMSNSTFANQIGLINIVLALPVFLYASFDYLKAAYISLKLKNIGVDIPIAIGILTLFLRSTYEILSHTGEGYLDSFTGFVFFLLIGRWFQDYTYKSISFSRDFKSFFPISVNLKKGQNWIYEQVTNLKINDIILIKNEEIIPCDGIVKTGSGNIDYSFVTGESNTTTVSEGDKVYAGGKQFGSTIEISVNKTSKESNLMQLWNVDIFQTEKNHKQLFIDKVGKYFTISILLIALFTGIYWSYADSSKLFNVVTAVLIVACPCVIALAVPFLYGNALRQLISKKIYCKNVSTLIRMNDINHVVFDKTGTLTDNEKMTVEYQGKTLTNKDKQAIKSLCGHSNHPLSAKIYDYFNNYKNIKIQNFKEHSGKGIEGTIDNDIHKVGSASFIASKAISPNQQSSYYSINNQVIGQFIFFNKIRKSVKTVMKVLSKRNKLSIISGDQSTDLSRIQDIVPTQTTIQFDQTPIEKLNYIKHLQDKSDQVMMIGDGLNDAGAFRQANISIALTNNENNFTPACDVILPSKEFNQIPNLFDFVRRLDYALYGALVLAFLYNSIGLFFAVTGALSPIVAAILMPISSISIVLYGIVASDFMFKKTFK